MDIVEIKKKHINSKVHIYSNKINPLESSRLYRCSRVISDTVIFSTVAIIITFTLMLAEWGFNDVIG